MKKIFAAAVIAVIVAAGKPTEKQGKPAAKLGRPSEYINFLAKNNKSYLSE